MDVDINEIKSIAKKAGEEILRIYESDYDVSYKDEGKKSPVTDADLAANKIIINGLSRYGWPILSEESVDDKSRLNSEYLWTVDPLDGTSDFIKHTGEFSVIIGLIFQKQPVMGVVYEPVCDTFYWAEKNEGAYRQKAQKTAKISVSKNRSFSEMTLLTSRFHLGEAEVKLFKKLNFKAMKKVGSCGLKMIRIAIGEGDLYINSSDKSWEWDTSAPHLILEEAGGRFTDLKGNAITYNNELPRLVNGYIASNGARHAEIIEGLRNL